MSFSIVVLHAQSMGVVRQYHISFDTSLFCSDTLRMFNTGWIFLSIPFGGQDVLRRDWVDGKFNSSIRATSILVWSWSEMKS